jgi:tetratricopeptide (TPR) repeat protein
MMPAEPHDGLARAQLLLGTAADRLGDRATAIAAYNQAVTLAPPLDSTDIRGRARAALARPPAATITNAYRLSLDGWRALEQGNGTDAVAMLARAVSLTPADSVAVYRYSRALQANGDAVSATAMRERVINARPPAPAIVLASAFVDVAAILERDGARQRAIEWYQRALASVGGAPDAHETARLGLKRLAP